MSRAILAFGFGFVAIAAIFLSLGLPSSNRSDSGRASTDSYVGSRSCAACHPGEFAAHSRSGHARTLRPAAETAQAARLNGATFPDPEHAGALWSYALRDGRFWTERTEGTNVERFLIDYAFGSGHHATTFVTMTNHSPENPTMLEHRLTVYAHKTEPDITAGQGQARGPNRPGIGPSGRHFPTGTTLKCFECHTTVTSDRGPLVLDEATMIPNIGCERCHGPGKAHVQAARRGAKDAELAMPFGLGPRKSTDEIRLCGSCHRLPETVDRALIRPENPSLVRFQPVGLMQSACYRKSGGTLSCATCHDPHAKTSTDIPAYEAVCLSCHRGPSRTPCKVFPATGCVGCHMPRRDATRGMMMADHWIRTKPVAAANPPDSGP